MRSLLVALIAALALNVGAASAEASCLRQTLAEHAERAEVVAFGAVSGSSFEIRQVLKGQAGGTLQVRFGEGGPGVVTSVDYMHEDGAHTLYLTRDGSGYATNACTGSHPGVPTAEERAFFSVGEVATSGGAGVATSGETSNAGTVALYAPVALAVAVIVGALAAFVLIRSRRGAST